MRYNLNFKNPNFKESFGREPKKWTLSEIHSLWMTTVERCDKRRNLLYSIWEKIQNEIEPNSRGSYIVYYEQDSITYKYTITPNIMFNYSLHTDKLNFSNNNGLSRDEKIDFLTNKRAHELGTEYYNARSILSYIDKYIFEILNDMVSDELRTHYSKSNTRPPKIFTVEIGESTHYVLCEEVYSHYSKFQLGDIVSNSIKITDIIDRNK